MVTNDEELLQQILNGSQDAFRELVERYKAYVFAIILNLLPASSDVEDVAQEVFLQIYRSLPDYQSQNFKAWLGKISVNKALDWKRSQVRHTQNETLDLEILKDDNENHAPDLVFLKKENREYLDQICRQLPSIYSQVIYNYYFESKSYEEIAQKYGISIKTVESRLYRAKALIKKQWKEEIS